MISIDYHRLLTNQINAKFSLKKNKKDTESQILSFQSSLSSFYRNHNMQMQRNILHAE